MCCSHPCKFLEQFGGVERRRPPESDAVCTVAPLVPSSDDDALPAHITNNTASAQETLSLTEHVFVFVLVIIVVLSESGVIPPTPPPPLAPCVVNSQLGNG